MSAVIEFSDVTIVRDDKRLLDRVSWKVREGERWVLLGPNGAGKTTLLQVASAHMHPTSGKAKILGERLGRVDVFDLRTRIGHTSSSVAEALPKGEPVRDVVMSAAYAVTGRWQESYEPEDHARANQMMGELGILTLADRTFGTLSEGEKKRVLIARSLMSDPELLLLDEPAAGLDLGGREDLIASLKVLAEDDESPVMVLVSHHVEEIPQGFTHVLMLRNGKVSASGPIEQTLTAEKLSATFGMRLAVDTAGGRYSARRADYGRRSR
ncbi:ABC transporter ATP-binding protein [soil metagenome]